MANELVKVDFYGDKIEATMLTDGRVVVGLRQLCRVTQQDYEKQLSKLKSRTWAWVDHAMMLSPDGVKRRSTVIDLETLHGWLMSINENRVPEAIRPKLVRYQKECVEVLRRHFSGQPATADSLLACIQTIHRTAGVLVEVRQRQIATEQEVAAVREMAERANTTAEAALRRADGNLGYVSILGYYVRHGREVSVNQASKHGKSMSALCRSRGIEIRHIADERHGRVNLYPESLLREYFEPIWRAEDN